MIMGSGIPVDAAFHVRPESSDKKTPEPAVPAKNPEPETQRAEIYNEVNPLPTGNQLAAVFDDMQSPDPEVPAKIVFPIAAIEVIYRLDIPLLRGSQL